MPSSPTTPLARQIARELGTPAVVIDLDVVERNIAKLQQACDAAGLANRPHIKTHKSPVLATMQRDAGAKGITCQKLGEAEVMAAGGHHDILISYNLLGEEKMARLARLVRDGISVRPCADNPVVVDGYAEAARIADREIGVLVECDTGRERAGVETPREAIALARRIAGHSGLRFDGVLLYAPEDKMLETQAFLDETRAGLAEHGLALRIVSTGGTPNLRNLGRIEGATEHRSGTSIFNDRMMLACGAASLEDCALAVYATVVSRAGPERGILDSGSKTLTSDTGGGLDGHGLIREFPKARIKGFAEEHGMLDLGSCDPKPEIGDVVSIIPNHVCVVVNMVDRLVTVRGDKLVGTLEVAARGKIV
jgi:D-serine deaminase-like pyridoxal phosphate-dependent protein